MIAKQIRGRDFGVTIRYNARGYGSNGKPRSRAELLYSTLPGSTPAELTRAFNSLKALRPSLGVVCMHGILAFRPDAPAPSDQVAVAVAKAWATGLGYQDFAVYAHEPWHIHLVMSRINRDGTVVSDRHNYTRSEKIVRRLEVEYSLAGDLASHLLNRRLPGARAPPVAGRA